MVRKYEPKQSDGEEKRTEPDVSIRTDGDHEGDSFPNAIWPVLALAQCFGLMPVAGIHGRNPTSIAFRWRTPRTLVTGVYLLLAVVAAVLYLRSIVYLGINANNMVAFVFYSSCCLCGALFLSLAQRWKQLIATWCRYEAVFLAPPYASIGWTLSTKIRFTAAIFLSLALFEHIMFFSAMAYNYLDRYQKCLWNTDDAWKTFVLSHYPYIFKVFPYHFVISIIVLYTNFTFTFAWNYMDVFVMMVSIGLSTRFRQFNVRLARLASSKHVTGTVWHEIRQHYVQLCELLDEVNIQLAPIIFLSCANNSFFICTQLINIFKSLPHVVHYLYFWYSLLYLIGRTICMLLYAAAIHDESLKPLENISHTQTSNWSPELERFSEQVTNEIIALSGMKFFNLTRRMIFGMAGTIITYELVLLQIEAGSKKTDYIGYCDQPY